MRRTTDHHRHRQRHRKCRGPDADTGEPDIVITAQGRRQILQDVPLAVTAVGGEQLQNSGANDIRQLNQLAPSLLVSSTGTEANGSARIRGIGTVGDNPGLESSVAVFIDGVYRSRSGIGLNELGEVERIEVLRGPQGTLFGRNASAGLIHIITRRPELGEFGGYGELTYGNYNQIRAAGAINVPLGATLAGRIDAVYVQRDGFYHVANPTGGTERRVNDRDRIFVRGQLLFEPNDTLSFRLIGDYTNRDESCCGAVYLDRATTPSIGNLNEPANPLLVGGVTNPDGNNIINVLRDLGQPLAGFSNPYSRTIYVSPGRTFVGNTEDWGFRSRRTGTSAARPSPRSPPIATISRGSPATSTIARSTSCTAPIRAWSAISRRSARNCGCTARPWAAISTGWSAPISPTRI